MASFKYRQRFLGPPWAQAMSEKLDRYIQSNLAKEAEMASVKDLSDAIERNRTVTDSVVTLLQGISQQIKDAQTSQDPAAMDQVVSQIDSNTQRLAQAVQANTPAATQPAGASTPNPTPPPGQTG